MNDNSVFFYTLDFSAFLWLFLKRKKPKMVFYVKQKINDKLINIIKTKMSVYTIPELYVISFPMLEFEHKFYDYIDTLFTPPPFFNEVYSILNELGLETEKLIKSFKKYLASSLHNDAAILEQAQNICREESNKYIYINELRLLKNIFNNNKVHIRKRYNFEYIFPMYLGLIKNALKCLKIIFFKKGKIKYTSKKINYIIEQLYTDAEGNAEFDCFFRYFKKRDDVLYICVKGNIKSYNKLRSFAKPVIFKDNISLLFQWKKEDIKMFIKLLARTLLSTKLKSVIVKKSILKIIYNKLYYEMLFEKFKPLYYLKIRSDTMPEHPVITAIADKYNIKHIGYMHAYYSEFRTLHAYIDYHYYGLMGKCFLEKFYSKVWPNDIKYSVIGPICVEINDTPQRIPTKEISKKLVVSVFTRQDKRYTEYSYFEAVQNVWIALYNLKIPNLYVIFKEYTNLQWSEKFKKDLYVKYNLSYKNTYHKTNDNESRYFAGEVIGLSDIVIVASSGHSTVACEAIAKKKKLVILLPKDMPPHIFEYYQLPLIARNQGELENSLKWLLSIPNDEYEKLIMPIIDDWSKISDGNLIGNFIEFVENTV